MDEKLRYEEQKAAGDACPTVTQKNQLIGCESDTADNGFFVLKSHMNHTVTKKVLVYI